MMRMRFRQLGQRACAYAVATTLGQRQVTQVRMTSDNSTGSGTTGASKAGFANTKVCLGPASAAAAKEAPKQDEKKPVHPDVAFPKTKTVAVDGNYAAAHCAYALSDTAFIYPITPSSVMGELSDEWALEGRKNVFNQELQITEMQSEGGAAGAMHGAIKAGSLATTFTSSQGVLLMIPNMYRISGELQPCVMHIVSRAVATHALNIFGDHSDVIAVKQTGWVMVCSDSSQVAHDMALVSHLATLDCHVPIVHFFEGFRTSHEVSKVELLGYDKIQALVPHDLVQAHRNSKLHPSHPHIQANSHPGAAFMQAMEAANPFYDAVPEKLQKWMDKVAEVTGRKYKFFEYEGHKEPEHLVVVMGTGGVTIGEYVKSFPNEKIGVLKVRVFRPWCPDQFLKAIPSSVKRITVLDRCKDFAANGDPLFHDVAGSLMKTDGPLRNIGLYGGRFGLGGKEFTPGMVEMVFKNMKVAEPMQNFTVGINDDVTKRSLPLPVSSPSLLPQGTKQCIFVGLGSDGTVGANKSAIKLIGEGTELFVQGFFQFDSKKSGSRTVSHLRFGPKPINAPYLIQEADYIAFHKENFVFALPKMLNKLKEGGIVVLNAKYNLQDRESFVPASFKRQIAQKKAKFYRIDAAKICMELGLGKKINMVMQAVFFYLSQVLPFEQAIAMLKADIKHMFRRKPEKITEMNLAAVDAAVAGLVQIDTTGWENAKDEPKKPKKLVGSDFTPERMKYMEQQMIPMATLTADAQPVSAFTPGGYMPLGTAAAEKRGIALQVPQVDMDKCTQCNYCSIVCPHAAIRPFLLTADETDKAPDGVKSHAKAAIGGGMLDNYKFKIQVSPLDCTGCELCVQVCPSNCLEMVDLDKALAANEDENFAYCVDVPNHGSAHDKTTVKGSQFQRPLLEFSGACEGCGETAYVKLLTQLFGDRLVLANATGCSRVWGATVSSAYTTYNGSGPAMGNSLFEDNAEYGFGMLKAQVQMRDLLALECGVALNDPKTKISDTLRRSLDQFCHFVKDKRHDSMLGQGKSMYQVLRDRIVPLLEQEKAGQPLLERVWDLRDSFLQVATWSIGGDGWAYDIGFGGLDHVLASGENVKVLVLDTETYSNTGGQVSKASSTAAAHKFAAGGKPSFKKDMGQYAIATYGNVYVASVNINANHQQTVKALLEAEAYPGPALVLCYCPCITHGYTMKHAIEQARNATASGYWPLYRYNPSLAIDGNNPFQLDSKKVSVDLLRMMKKETRFTGPMRERPEHAKMLANTLKKYIDDRMARLKFQADFSVHTATGGAKEEGGITVLYGSETGNAEDLAKNFVSDLVARGAKGVSVSSMDDFDFSELPNVRNLICIVSTCGLGEYPQNCKQFWKELSNPDLPLTLLKDVKFTVFGLGDSTYAEFCKTAKEIDVRLAELGATRVAQRGTGDDVHEDRYFTGWEEWVPGTFKTFDLPPQPLERKAPAPAYEITINPGGDKPLVDLDKLCPVGAVPVKLIKNQLLTPQNYDRDIRHYEFEIKGSPIRYQCGESLAIFPKTQPKHVQEMCQLFGLNPNDELDIVCKPEARTKLPNACNVAQLFGVYLDVYGKPSKKFFENLLNFATDDAEKAELEKIISEDKERLKALQIDMVNYIDVFKKFPKTRPSLAHLCNIIPAIRPRSYSISSSPVMHPDKIELTVVKVDWVIPSTKEERFGLTTDYMDDRQPDELINVAIRKSAIVVPEDITRPIIMAGMGTGIAPWRAMTQQRVHLKRQGHKVGPVVMFYGARKAAGESLYKEELDEYIKEGVLELHCAFSRDQKHKIYVQHRIVEASKVIYDYMVNKNGCFYVCGSSRNVPEDVYKAMNQCMVKEGKITSEEADAMLETMKREGRYIVEAWA